jgi:hypothetical protein
MPEIVCNTTPLQYLHQAGVLEVIPALYGRSSQSQTIRNFTNRGTCD